MKKTVQIPKLFKLKQIVEETSNCTGTTFFKSLVKNLSKILDVSGVWVTEYMPKENKLNSLAFWFQGKNINEYKYSIKDTPCEKVLETHDFCHFSNHLVEIFPNDPDLPGLNAVSYLGISLRDTDGKILGHLAALDSKPMKEIPEYFVIFKIFASRASAELRRLKREQNLKESREKLDRILNGTSEAIIEIGQNWNITQCNHAAEKEFGRSSKLLTGMNLEKLFIDEHLTKIKHLVKSISSDNQSTLQTKWMKGNIECISASKKTFPARVAISSYVYQNQKYFALFIRNIAKQVRTEEKLKQLNAETDLLRKKLTKNSFNKIIGQSEKILQVIELISKVAPTDSTVIITGETGTGKELIAEAIYKNSKRKNKAFVELNCAALPSELIESELFGHVKGAFTGAVTARQGRFLTANGGTIFLDEIGEMPINLQSKLLRIIQEGEFEPVGSSKTIKVDVRIIAATHRKLLDEVKKGNFREDLFYRLHVFPIPVPPLRDRYMDIILLAEAFMEKLGEKEGKILKPLSEHDKQVLLAYQWPGNVRELRNIIERAIIVSKDDALNISNLIPVNRNKFRLEKTNIASKAILTEEEIIEIQKHNIMMALKKTNWKISGENGAAKLLKLAPTTLASRISKYRLKR